VKHKKKIINNYLLNLLLQYSLARVVAPLLFPGQPDEPVCLTDWCLVADKLYSSHQYSVSERLKSEKSINIWVAFLKYP